MLYIPHGKIINRKTAMSLAGFAPLGQYPNYVISSTNLLPRWGNFRSIWKFRYFSILLCYACYDFGFSPLDDSAYISLSEAMKSFINFLPSFFA